MSVIFVIVDLAHSNVKPHLNLKKNDYDNIYGLDQYLSREEYEQIIQDRFG